MRASRNRLSPLGSSGVLLGLLLWAGTALAQDSEGGAAAAAIAGTMLLFFLAVGLAAYIYVALALQTIATKTATPNGWLAWIPIANIFLMLSIAKKPMWWFILCLVPLVNIVIIILIWMGVAEARHKPNWWGILMIVPIANLIVPGYLAWAD
jgi:hypothetical protein